jgi:hypothetical protein
MQPFVIPPRETLDDDTIVRLLRDSPGVVVGNGCEFIDQDLNIIEDITVDFVGGSVSRNSYNNIHATASLSVARELPFGWAILRPYMTITDGVDTAKFRLGAYVTDTPERQLEEFPVIYQTTCTDILSLLDDQVGDSYAVATGAVYLTEIETILRSKGFSQFVIDPAAIAKTTPTPRVWAFDQNMTWLTIVNDLLAAIGYQGVWSDWDGRLRLHQYETPSTRSSEWTYDTEELTSMLGTKRSTHRDFAKAPNRWIFVRQNNVDDTQPIEGNGIYIYNNIRDGDTSQEARMGRVITKKVMIDAADQASLEAAAQITIDADQSIPVKVSATTNPNPLHWHFDVITIDDPAQGPVRRALATEWTLPLDGSEMSHEWTILP